MPWTFTIETSHEDGQPLYIVHVNELPVLGTDAPTIEEAFKQIYEVMRVLFEWNLKDGIEIPEPGQLEDFKGNIAYRTTPQRHFTIASEAKRKNLSLSQVIDSFIDKLIAARR